MRKKQNNFFKIFTFIIIFTALPVGVFLISQQTNFFQKAFGTNANIEVDAGNINNTSRKEVWRYLAQGGEEKGRQLLPVVEKVKILQPKYIRIDHVFDYYDIVSGDNSSYNFTKLDEMITDIRATGAKPFIALSYMPASMSSGDITDYPKDWGAWERLITATVEHISGRAGLNIDGVYYEVWNEPDLFGGFKTRGNKNYLELYRRTANGVARAQNVNSFKLGGPATTGFYENWHNKLLEFAQTHNIRLDFLSWHKYSKQMFDYEKDLENAIRYGSYELVISESGPNSENDPVYDGSFAAIHTIGLAALLEGKIDQLHTFEIKDGAGPQKNWGRWGILTHEKFGNPEVKPRYNALLYLNRLNGGQSLNVNGAGSWVKAIAKTRQNPDGTTKIQLLMVNYDQAGRHNESVPVKITNLPSNIAKLTRTDFGGRTTTSDLNLVDNKWEISVYMVPNTASLFELVF